MTFDEWIKKYEGKTWGYPAGNYVGECLSLTKWHIKEVYGINPPASGCNGARCYWSIFPSPLDTIFKKVPNTPDLVPKKGWIAVWNEKVGGGYGHIASVISANINTFVSLDQNWNGRSAHRVTHDYNNVYGFLVPKNEQGGDMVEVPSADFEELVRKSSEYDKFVKAGYSSVDDVEEDKKLCDQKVKGLENTIRELNQEIEDHVCYVIPEDPDEWLANGKTVTYIGGDTEVTINYERKK